MPRPLGLNTEGRHGAYDEVFRAADLKDTRAAAAAVLGGAGLPGFDAPERMGASASTAEYMGLPESFRKKLAVAHAETRELFSGDTIPTLKQLATAGCITAGLARAYEAMVESDGKPELVIAPVNLSLEKTKALCTSLSTATIPLTAARSITDRWDALTHPAAVDAAIPAYFQRPQSLVWTVRSVDGNDFPAHRGISHDGLGEGGTAIISPVKFPHIVEYILLQARLVNRGEKPVDHSSYTWLDGCFWDEKNEVWYGVAGSWSNGKRSVKSVADLVAYEKDDQPCNVGARPALWDQPS